MNSDGWTDGPTNKVAYRVACTRLKRFWHVWDVTFSAIPSFVLLYAHVLWARFSFLTKIDIFSFTLLGTSRRRRRTFSKRDLKSSYIALYMLTIPVLPRPSLIHNKQKDSSLKTGKKIGLSFPIKNKYISYFTFKQEFNIESKWFFFLLMLYLTNPFLTRFPEALLEQP